MPETFASTLRDMPRNAAHGADALAKLFEKAAFGIGMFGHGPAFVIGNRNFWKHNADED